MTTTIAMLAADVHRLEGRVSDIAGKQNVMAEIQTQQGTQIAVIAARQQTITDIHDNVTLLVSHVIGSKEIPGVVSRLTQLEVFESREHGALAVVIFVAGALLSWVVKSLVS